MYGFRFGFGLPARVPAAAAPVVPLSLDFGALDPRLDFVRASPATRVGADGLIATAGIGEARIDHDPADNSALGLLIEEQRTNFKTYSEDIANGAALVAAAGMQPVGSGSLLDQTAAPDGATSADFIAENTNTGSHYIYGAARSDASDKSLSIFCKAATRTSGRIQIGDGALSAGISAEFELIARTIGAEATHSTGYTAIGQSRIAPAANGFYRCSVNASTPATSHVGYIALNDGSGISYAGDGSSGLYIWGWQLELGAFPTSYIPTTGGATTRAADSCSSTHPDFIAWLARTQKTVVVTADSPASGTRRIFHAAKTGDETNNFLSIYTDEAEVKIAVTSDGAAQANLTLGTIGAGTPFTVALSLANNDVQASLGGAARITHANAAIPACDKLWLGCGPAGEQLCGHLSGSWQFLSDTGDVEALSG
jgi:hypothetical protein